MPVTGFLHAGSLGLRSNLVAAFRRAARDVETALSCLLFPKTDIQLPPDNVRFRVNSGHQQAAIWSAPLTVDILREWN
jgi:hypothetical protein